MLEHVEMMEQRKDTPAVELPKLDSRKATETVCKERRSVPSSKVRHTETEMPQFLGFVRRLYGATVWRVSCY